MSDPATFNLADLFEIITATCPDRTAVVADGRRWTYAELNQRADRLAAALAARGIGRDDFVGVLSWNRIEWCEAMVACHKVSAASVNINYRYTAAELRYLLHDADLMVIIVERAFVPLVAAAIDDTVAPPTLLILEDGTPKTPLPDGLIGEDYEAALAAAPPLVSTSASASARSSDDRYVLYTGGTTGMPKGVLWRCEDIFKAAMQGADIVEPSQVADRAAGEPLVMSVVAPLMHGAAQWAFWITTTSAGTFALWTGRSYDAAKILTLLATERAAVLTVVGDAMVRPLAEELEAHPDTYDLSGLAVMASGGAILSPAVREVLVKHLPQLMIIDGYGASETGFSARAFDNPGQTQQTFTLDADAAVLDDNLEPVVAGSGVIGRLARRGNIPLGYHGDPEKTAATFPVDAAGVRWSVPGDLAMLEADGSVRLLGRGSTVINTGGEKVFPDEVEQVMRGHAALLDAVVVGVPHERFGQQVTALVVVRPNVSLDLAELDAYCRAQVAGYKVPRQVFVVAEIQRTPAGKPDQRWVAETAAVMASAVTA